VLNRGALNRIHAKKTNSSNPESENYECLKNLQNNDGRREGKSQARKSYCRELFLLTVELISP